MTQEQGNQIAQEAIEQFPSSENLFYAKRNGYTTAATKYLYIIEQKDKEIGELSIHYFNHVHEIERLKTALESIKGAPTPYNEMEMLTWIEVARNISIEALNNLNH